MKKIIIIILICQLHIFASGQSVAVKIDEYLAAYAKVNRFNGTALVAQKGKILLEKGYGFKDASQASLDDVNTIYQVGSVTKQFTSAIILKLQEQKKLSVKDKLGKYFPDFPNADKITIENLLTHTSGIYNYTNDSKFMANEITHSYTRDKMMALFRNKPLDFDPGTKFRYSNSGYSMLGYIIEKVTKKPYEQVMREFILQPLHMNHSGFDFTHLKSADKAVGYLVLNNSIKAIAPIVDSSISFAAGALYSTVEDLFKWERSTYNNSILKQESWQAAFTPFKEKYGYGWIIDTLFNKQVISHGGGIHGFNSNLFRMPQEEIVIILLNNKGNPSLDEITKGIAAIILGRKYELPKDRVGIAVREAVLQGYVGEYELNPNLKMTVKLENGSLKGQLTGQPAFDMFAEKESFFFLKVVDAQVEFFKGSDGKTDQLILYQGGQKIPAKKIK
jgi:CubicO group peptidase (beta-lactamase class C family)